MARRKNHPGSIDKRGDTYRLRLTVGGRTHAFNLKNVTRGDAEGFARKKHQELVRQEQRAGLGFVTGMLFSELLTLFRNDFIPTLAQGTQKAYGESLKPIEHYFIQELRDPQLDGIRAQHIKGYLSWRRSHRPSGEKRTKPVSNQTLLKDRAVLHRVFAIADRLELREGNPVSRVEPPKSDGRDPVILTREEYERLLTAAEVHPMLELYLLLLGETGCRSHSEGAWLRWEDIDLQEGFLWIASGRHGHRTKSGKGRWVPLTPRLRQGLQDHFAHFRFGQFSGVQSPWVFHHLPGYRVGSGKPGERIGNFRSRLTKAVERAKLPDGFVLHDLRHRRATTWLADGQNVVHVKEALGHSDLRTTMGYTHLAKEHLRALVQDESRTGESRSQAS